MEDSPDHNDSPSHSERFIAELHGAAAEASVPNTHRAETNWPFASPLEIPLIEQDSMEPVAYWPEHHEEFVMEENEDNESEEDIVNQICESTWISNAGAINQMSEENYGHCWTGM